jgi:putative N6-adenine-specific DNA methylase
MEGLAIAPKGLEFVSSAEITEILGAEVSIEPTALVFPVKDVNELCRLAYLARSLRRVLLIFGAFNASQELPDAISNLRKLIDVAPFSEWLGNSFKVNCERHGTHEFSSQDLAKETGEIIFEKTKVIVDLKNPDTQLFIYINDDKGYFGIDIAGFELDKREYRIMLHPKDFKATISYSLLKIAGYTGKEVLLDPFAHSGTNLIEAALYASKKSVNYYKKDAFAFNRLKPFSGCQKIMEKADSQIKEKIKPVYAIDSSMQSLKSAEKNAKVAGVNKLIDFSRLDVSWLDTKFGKGEIDIVVSQLPFPSKTISEDFVSKLLKELFYQLEYILSAKGKCVFLTKSSEFVKKLAAKFTVVSENELFSGEEKLVALVLAKIK